MEPSTTTERPSRKDERKRILTGSIPEGPALDDALVYNNSKQGKHNHSSSTSMSLLVRTSMVFFFVAFLWHSTILPFLYLQIGPQIAAWITFSGSHLDAFRDPQFIDPKVLREFGFAGAAAHTSTWQRENSVLVMILHFFS
jgi:hypothetical protein